MSRPRAGRSWSESDLAAERAADRALTCARLRFLAGQIADEGQREWSLACDLRDFADLIEVAQARGWFR